MRRPIFQVLSQSHHLHFSVASRKQHSSLEITRFIFLLRGLPSTISTQCFSTTMLVPMISYFPLYIFRGSCLVIESQFLELRSCTTTQKVICWSIFEFQTRTIRPA